MAKNNQLHTALAKENSIVVNHKIYLSSSNRLRRSSDLVRRTPKTGITSAKVKRGSFSLGRSSGMARRTSAYVPTKLRSNVGTVSAETSSENDTRGDLVMGAEDVNRLRQHAVSKAISYENLGVTEKKRRSSTKMTEMERMQFRLKESYELIDKLSEQLIPYLQDNERMGILPKKQMQDKSASNNSDNRKKSSKSAAGGQTPSYRIIEIRSLRKRAYRSWKMQCCRKSDKSTIGETQLKHYSKIEEV